MRFVSRASASARAPAAPMLLKRRFRLPGYETVPLCRCSTRTRMSSATAAFEGCRDRPRIFRAESLCPISRLVSVAFLSRAAASAECRPGRSAHVRLELRQGRVGCGNYCESFRSGVHDNLVGEIQLLCAGLELRDRVAHGLYFVSYRQRRLPPRAHSTPWLPSVRLVRRAARALCRPSLARSAAAPPRCPCAPAPPLAAGAPRFLRPPAAQVLCETLW